MPGLKKKIAHYKSEQNLNISTDETSTEEQINFSMPITRPSISNSSNEKIKIETLPLQPQKEETEYYICPKTKKSKIITDKLINKALGVFISLGDIIYNKNNNEEISTERKVKSSSLTARSRDNLPQIVSKKPGRKKNSLTNGSRSDTASISSSTENSENNTTHSESSLREKVSLALPPLTDAPLNSVSKSESLQIQQMQEIKENLNALKKSANENVIETFNKQTSDNNLNEVLEGDNNKVSFKENANLGFFANQSNEDSPKSKNQSVKSPSSSDNTFSVLELCILAGLSLTIVGLLVVIPYVIYKTCCLDLNVDEPEPSGLSMK